MDILSHSILPFLAIIVVLIVVHELGHFITAKLAGVKVLEFGLGYPPRLWGVKRGETEYTVDSRPSDAIALALRVAAPIFVEEEVFPKAGKMEVAKETTEPVKTDDPEQLREWLQNIKPEDFEKYNKA